ncbi:MAG: insulinase family protein [Lentisphaeria bacterium]|nr:insulinase family protein [Lentisphaeria bacterium]
MKKTAFPVLADLIVSRQFDNGLRVFVLPRRHSASVTMQAYVATGSIHEGKYLGCGLSHFLEHMLFQGTTEFPGNQISERIAAFGGELNAATSAEFTYAYFNLPPEHLADGLTMLDSMIREPLLPADQFRSEREVILRELAMYKDSPVQNLFEQIRMNLLRVHPLRYSTGGFADRLAEVTPEIMREYHALRYTPGRTFYVVTGDAEPDKVFDLLEKRTARWARGSLEEPLLPAEPPCPFPRRTRIEFPAPQAYYGAVWLTPGAIKSDFIAVNAFSDILGNGDSSRLYEELVNRRMLVQDILFYSCALSSLSYSCAVAIAEPENMSELSKRTFDILQNFIQSGPTEEELERLRINQKSDYLRALQTNEGVAPLIGKSVLHYGSPDAVDSYLPALDALTPADLIRAGRKYFRDQAPAVIEQYPAGTLRQQKKRSIECKPHTPQLTAFPAGQKLLYLENRTLPLVTFTVILPGGMMNETPAQAGLTRLLAETLDSTCGKFSEAEFDRRLENNAIDLNIEAGISALSITASCPSEKLPQAVELIGAMMSDPLFPADAVKREKETLCSSIRTAMMKPASAAKDMALHQLFGSHPFGRGKRDLLKTIGQLKAKDLLGFYRKICLSAPRAVFGFTGDLSRRQAEKLTAQIIEGCRWNDYRPAPFPAPVFPAKETRETASLPRRQAVVFAALPGVQTDTPDADIVNLVRLHSDSMASRLFQTVRNQNGLVYYASFLCQCGFGFDGYMGYCGATTAEGCEKLEKIFRQEIRHLARNGMTAEEFENARKMIKFQLESIRQSPEELLAALTAAEFIGSGWECYWNRQDRLAGLTFEAFNRRVRKLFTGAKPAVAVVLPEKPEDGSDEENV